MDFVKNPNEFKRQQWLKKTLSRLPNGWRLLDAGAGELKNRKYCAHLDYVSQDFCQYKGGEGYDSEGLQLTQWDTTRIDLISDITSIPSQDESFDAILCSEVLEHVPEPTHALDEFTRLLKPGGILIITAPFSSIVHMAPYYYCTGFSKYWYEHHLVLRGFEIKELVPNGGWYSLLRQEIIRLGSLEYKRRSFIWPVSCAFSLIGVLYFMVCRSRGLENLACFGWHCVARKKLHD